MELTQEQVSMVMNWFQFKQGEGMTDSADELLFEDLVRSGMVSENKPCSCCELGCCGDPGHCCQNHTCEEASWRNGVFLPQLSEPVEQFCCRNCERLS